MNKNINKKILFVKKLNNFLRDIRVLIYNIYLINIVYFDNNFNKF